MKFLKFVTLAFVLSMNNVYASEPSIVIAKGKSGKVEAVWKGSHRPTAGDVMPTDEDIAALAARHEIQVLNFDGQMGGPTGLTGSGLSALVDLPNLEEIRINGINVASMRTPQGAIPFGTEGFQAMAKMKKLRVLWIQHAHIPVDDVAELLRASASLEEVTTGGLFCDEILIAASQAPKLRHLKFGHWDSIPKDSPLTMAGYRKLAECKSLESLDTGIRHPEGATWQALLSVLSEIKSLKKLNLQCGEDPMKRRKGDAVPAHLTASDLKQLSPLKQLKELGLMNARFESGAFTALADIPTLETLQLRASSFDESEVRALMSKLPKLKIFVTEGQPIKTRKL
jgi:hypothetical protein